MALELADGLTLYFCRHGETEANVEGLFQGLTVDTPLTARGEKQARRIGKILKRHLKEPADLAYVSSPLPRARKTMSIIRGKLDLPPRKFTTDKRLVEINLGAWDGLTHKQARAENPKLYARREADKWSVRTPGGENYADVAKRAKSWLATLDRDTVAVTHGCFTRVLRGLFEDLTWQEISGLDEPQGVVFRVRGHKVKQLDAK
jgi:broad specificity phosphatase PhoE